MAAPCVGRCLEYLRRRALCCAIDVKGSGICKLTVIVILALVALFIGLRLYSVLGERTGHEQQPISSLPIRTHASNLA